MFWGLTPRAAAPSQHLGQQPGRGGAAWGGARRGLRGKGDFSLRLEGRHWRPNFLVTEQLTGKNRVCVEVGTGEFAPPHVSNLEDASWTRFQNERFHTGLHTVILLHQEAILTVRQACPH